MMIDAEILDKVKSGLNIAGNYNDNTLSIKMLAVKQFMINAGIDVDKIESELGIVALTVGVNDLWNLSSGDVRFSTAFNILLAQLQIISLPNPVVS